MSEFDGLVEPTSRKIKPPSYMLESYSKALEEKFPEQVDMEPKKVALVKKKAFKALERGRHIMQAIDKARVANEKDPTQNDIAKKVNTYRYADKKVDEMGNIFSNVENEIHQLAKVIDEQVNEPITDRAINSKIAKEVRNHVKQMTPKSERVSFVREAINEGDTETVESILGSYSYLSGLDKETHQSLLEQYKEKQYSNEMQTREALNNLAKTIGKAYSAATHTVGKLDTIEVQNAMKKQDAARSAMQV